MTESVNDEAWANLTRKRAFGDIFQAIMNQVGPDGTLDPAKAWGAASQVAAFYGLELDLSSPSVIDEIAPPRDPGDFSGDEDSKSA